MLSGTLQVGVGSPEELPPGEAVDFAVSLERAGIHSAWFTEIVRDPFARATATATRTRELRVATGIALWSRSPITAAMTAAELHELSGGRFTYGVGTGTAYANESFHGISFERPARRMSEYLRVVRGAWAANADRPLDFRGEHFNVEGFSQSYFGEGPPLLLAAVQAGMLRLAARYADGVILNPASTPWYCREYALAELAAGAEAAGRSLDDVERAVCVRCAVDGDPSVARRWARLGICEYGQYPIHQRVYEMHGFGEAAAKIGDAMARGDMDAAVAAVDDEMVDTFSVAGTPEDARRQLAAWKGLVHTVALLPPAFGVGPDELRANCAAIRDAFPGEL
jgi:alkanesulfonate monooxygenase SsuD/methylene tetrahydromethanopterin reductase-like flavin-dependent oxidoreductase (luciferase family)